MIVSKDQLNRAACEYISRDMLPTANGELKRIALRGLRRTIEMCPDFLIRYIKAKLPVIEYTGIIDEDGNVEIDTLSEIAEHAIADDEIPFKAIGFTLHFNVSDIRALKSYIQ